MRTQYTIFKRNRMTSEPLDKKEVTTKASLFSSYALWRALTEPRRACQKLRNSGSWNCFPLQLHTLTDLSNFLSVTCWKKSLLKASFWVACLINARIADSTRRPGHLCSTGSMTPSRLTHLNHNENTVLPFGYLGTLQIIILQETK